MQVVEQSVLKSLANETDQQVAGLPEGGGIGEDMQAFRDERVLVGGGGGGVDGRREVLGILDHDGEGPAVASGDLKQARAGAKEIADFLGRVLQFAIQERQEPDRSESRVDRLLSLGGQTRPRAKWAWRGWREGEPRAVACVLLALRYACKGEGPKGVRS